MPALLAGIHVLKALQQQRRGWPGHKGVHARLRRAMPGHDGEEYRPKIVTLSPRWTLRARPDQRAAFTQNPQLAQDRTPVQELCALRPCCRAGRQPRGDLLWGQASFISSI